MKLINFLIRISKFVLLVGFFSSNFQLLAENKKNCSKDFPPLGTKLIILDENQWKIRVTKLKNLKDAPNNKSLAEHIALLKLDAVEEYQKFLKTKISSTWTKYGVYKYSTNFDSSWDVMKLSIAAMKDLGTCIEKNRILVSGGWSSKSVERVTRIFDLEEVFYELFSLEMEDPKFDIDKLEKKYPTILETEDPKVLRKVINNWRKNRQF